MNLEKLAERIKLISNEIEILQRQHQEYSNMVNQITSRIQQLHGQLQEVMFWKSSVEANDKESENGGEVDSESN